MTVFYGARPKLRENHPAKLEQGDDEDYIDYLNRQGAAWRDNPPPPPDGFELVPCTNEPKHWPEYTVVDNDFHGGHCMRCEADSLWTALQESRSREDAMRTVIENGRMLEDQLIREAALLRPLLQHVEPCTAGPDGSCGEHGYTYADECVVRLALDAQSEGCEHDSRTGVDETPLNDPSKLWRCDSCGEVTVGIRGVSTPPEGGAR